MKLKIENPTNAFRQPNLMLQLIKESRINSKTVMSLSFLEKKERMFVMFILLEVNFFKFFLSQCIVY